MDLAVGVFVTVKTLDLTIVGLEDLSVGVYRAEIIHYLSPFLLHRILYILRFQNPFHALLLLVLFV